MDEVVLLVASDLPANRFSVASWVPQNGFIASRPINCRQPRALRQAVILLDALGEFRSARMAME